MFADVKLARLLERAEAEMNARFVEARQRLFPERGAASIDLGGVYALYDGIDSPVTQTFGLGLFDPVGPAAMDKLEAFYRQRGAAVCHEVSPLGDPALLPLLTARRYEPVEFTSMMYLPMAERVPVPDLNPAVQVRLAAEADRELWARTGAEGWREFPEVAAIAEELGRVVAARDGEALFLAEFEGRPIAAGTLNIQGAVAILGGSSTIPEERRRGAQRALLDSRLRYAAEAGSEVAMMAAVPPGGASQRNAERYGFHIAYTRIKWKGAGPMADDLVALTG